MLLLLFSSWFVLSSAVPMMLKPQSNLANTKSMLRRNLTNTKNNAGKGSKLTIITGTGANNDGDLEVDIEYGFSQNYESLVSGNFKEGVVVYDDVLPQEMTGLRIRGPSKNTWVGSITFDGVPMICIDCFGTTSTTAEIGVKLTQTTNDVTKTRCLGGKWCSILTGFKLEHQCSHGRIRGTQYTEAQTPNIKDCEKICRNEDGCDGFTYGNVALYKGDVSGISYTSDGGRANECVMINAPFDFRSGWEASCRWNTYSLTGMENIFLQPYPGNRNNWNGEVGYEIEAKRSLNVVALGRSIYSGGKLNENAQVTLWDVESQSAMTSILVGPLSSTEKGYAYEILSSSIQLLPGKKYRLSQTCSGGMADKWNDASTALNQINYVDSSVTFIQGIYSTQGNVYPVKEDGVGRRPGMVTLYIRG